MHPYRQLSTSLATTVASLMSMSLVAVSRVTGQFPVGDQSAHCALADLQLFGSFCDGDVVNIWWVSRF